MTNFVLQEKLFKVNILGNDLELKIPNGVWLNLESEFDIKQSELNDKFNENYGVTGTQFIYSIFKFNDIDVTYKQLLNHLTQADVEAFMTQYNLWNAELLGDLLNLDEDDNEGK